MDTRPDSALVEAYDRDGFVNAGPLFEADEVNEIAAELERYVDAAFRGKDWAVKPPRASREITDPSGKAVQQFVNLWEVSPIVRRVVHDPRIARRAAVLAQSPTLQLWSDQVQYKAPYSGGAMTWHQDFLYWEPIAPSIMVTAWLALDDADEENGCMWMVPGSHLWGGALSALVGIQGITERDGFRDTPAWTPPPGHGPWNAPRACPVRAGEVHFHHCVTWHGSPDNRSTRARRALAIHYMPEGVHFDGNTSHPLTTQARVAKGGLMLEDREHFPVVWENGASVPTPEARSSTGRRWGITR